MRRIIISLLCLLAVLTPLQARPAWSFAIVVDSVSRDSARQELDDYARAIEELQDLKVRVIVDRWGVPDSIRQTLYGLYKAEKTPLCGVVFVGDIPIPMLRDAQHMTSAFKMDQREDRRESSVPSDRFYDDFDLRFDTLGHEAGTPFFYYSLRADCPQQLQPELFSGRIRPTDTPESSRYAKLRSYLRKAVRAKREPRELQQVFFFTGHGSLSESKVAAMDEKASYHEHFPWFKGRGSHISYMDFSEEKFIKEKLMNELMRPDLDFSVLHHHGEWHTQYLNAYTPGENIVEAKQQILRLVRHRISYLRKGYDRDSVTRAIAGEYGIPAEWVSDAFLPGWAAKDSISEARLNLSLPDFADYGFVPNSRLVVFDACYNGSFHQDNSIANAYIFAPGETVAAIGGTVNVLQDKWYDRFCGLLGAGLYVGYFNLFQNYLETHLIGDPTFAFAPSVRVRRLNETVASVLTGRKQSFKLDGPALGDLEALRLELNHRCGLVTPAQLLDAVCESPYGQVRLEALHLLAETGSNEFVQAIAVASQDPVEMVQRMAVNYIRQNGHPRLAAPLIRLLLQNSTSARVAFNAERALMYFPKDLLLAEFEKQFAALHLVHRNKVYAEKRELIEKNANYWEKEVDGLFRVGLQDKDFDFIASCMRLYCPHNQVDRMLSYIQTCGQPDRQIRLLEALGWMNCSYQYSRIASAVQAISENSGYDPAVRREALKTYNRVRK